MKPTVYLAGGINGLSDEEAKGWRNAAARELVSLYDILDPMVRDYRGVEAQNVEEIVTGDLLDISISDIVLVRAERPSWGTAMELVYAKEMGKYVIAFGAGERPSPWLVFHADHVAETLEAGVAQAIRVHAQLLAGHAIAQSS